MPRLALTGLAVLFLASYCAAAVAEDASAAHKSEDVWEESTDGWKPFKKMKDSQPFKKMKDEMKEAAKDPRGWAKKQVKERVEDAKDAGGWFKKHAENIGKKVRQEHRSIFGKKGQQMGPDNEWAQTRGSALEPAAAPAAAPSKKLIQTRV